MNSFCSISRNDRLGPLVRALGIAIAAVAAFPTPSMGGLALEIATPKASLVAGEPLLVVATLLNHGPSAEEVIPSLTPSAQYARILVASDGTTFVSFNDSFARDPAVAMRTMRPGDAIVHEELLAFDWRNARAAFPDPGAYLVRAEYRFGGKAVESNVLRVTVTEPRGSDVSMADLVADPSVLEAMSSMRSARGVEQKIVRLARSDSTYAPFAALLLATDAATSEAFRSLPVDGRAGVSEVEHSLFGWLGLADQEGFVLRSRVVGLRAAVLRRLGDDAAATGEGERLLREFPDSAAAREWRESQAGAAQARANEFSMKEAPPFDDVSRGLEGIVLAFVREIPNGFVALGTSDILADDGEFEGRSKERWLSILRDQARAGPPPDRRRGMHPLFIWSERLDRQRAITTLAIEQFDRAQGQWETALLRVSVGWSGGSWRITRLERIGDEQPH